MTASVVQRFILECIPPYSTLSIDCPVITCRNAITAMGQITNWSSRQLLKNSDVSYIRRCDHY